MCRGVCLKFHVGILSSLHIKVLQQCNCTPSFHALGYKERPVFCLGLQLLCMNNIMKFIGKYNKVGATN